MDGTDSARIRGRRVWLRALEGSDLPAYKRAINSVEVGSWAGYPWPHSDSTLERWFEEVRKHHGQGQYWFAISPLGSEYGRQGVAIVAIGSNDVESHPDDAPVRMVEFAAANGFTFPYLYDETQEVALAYRAACTPDFFVFDTERRLVYRGQLDGARPSNDVPVDGRDLRAALDAALDGAPIPEPQVPSMGCNIKWKAGNAPDYFPA